ncbi:transient receptor potential channel pyrexia [Asbolus verrucosus]|uniref:Transient receptor potential channel pyrexia n=1 Tax=Asbolus verrucosus TaxID=1661398 RepID=A0A482WE79_ASBVE|nr:transient receptor potential channel pyrexia [Asbolus verrucosus]
MGQQLHLDQAAGESRRSGKIPQLEFLQTLPQAEAIIHMIARNNVDGMLKKNPSTALLIATWLEKEDILRQLLEKGVSLRAVDEGGLTALHLAACVGNVECLKLLLQHGDGEVGAKDSVNKATPLHCAASKGHLSSLKVLIRHGADVNSGLTHKSPLHYAVQSRAVDCVKELLENNAIPNTPQVYSETPLHVAAALGASEIVKLLLEHGAAVDVQYGTDKVTPLHLAAEDGDAQCARLLIEAGAQLSSENHKKQTPLHLAALSQCCETMELLLSKGANPNARDTDGRTPLHSAIVKVSRSCECVKVLLSAGANVNQQDSFGYTALHLAALNEFSNCVMMLLNHGGDVTIRTNGGVSVLSFITRKTPDVIPRYIAKFDTSINVNDHEIGDVDCELKLDFRILVPTMGNKETELLLNFIEVGHREILKHPLCETFLFLKWRRIRKFFLFSLLYHSLFVLLYTVYVISVFVKDCLSQSQTGHHYSVANCVKAFGYLLLCFNFMLLGKEMFQICHSWRSYIKQWENWLQWLIIISVFCCVQPTECTNLEIKVGSWQHHVAAIGIFLAWVELMMIVGRFPIFGLYIQMFTRVAVNFVKFIAAYSCLLLAFALSFGILFANYKSFKDLEWVLLKVLVMMSGELEYEDIFYDSPIFYHWTAQVMFLVYVILVTVILANLMVGLAVSDIQGLQQSAGLDRLVRQAELVAHLESMLFSRLLKCIPHKLMKFFHRKALLLKSRYHWALYIKPNDPREERIPKDLIRSIYYLIVDRKEKPRGRKRRSNKFQYDVTSPPLSRMGSNSSTWGGIDRSQMALKAELDELNKEFAEFTRIYRQKMEQLTNQMLRSTK